MKIKIATWNMNYWEKRKLIKDSWFYFLNNVDADFYLFQESVPVDLLDKDNLVYNQFEERRDWGTGVYSKKYKLTKEKIMFHKPGSCAVATADIGKAKPLTLIS